MAHKKVLIYYWTEEICANISVLEYIKMELMISLYRVWK